MGKSKEKKRKFKLQEVMHPNAAGIDIGSSVHYVCVPEERDKERVRKFRCFTADILEMATWLKRCGVDTIAMESTGAYWIPVFQILESEGFQVCLVNAAHVKNVPGRKTDVQDCQWLQELHTFGLLRSSFRPEDQICKLRSYIRQRGNIIKSASTHIQRMQKALVQMNLHLHKVISDITGLTGTQIIEAILAGKRDPAELAKLKDSRIKSSVDEIAKSLEGDYRPEHLFSLQQEYNAYKFFRSQLTECDQAIQAYVQSFDSKVDTKRESLAKGKNSYNRKALNYPQFDLRSELYRITGTDFTAIDGLDILSVQTIISEIGLNPNKWPTVKHFTSWLGLCPNNRITGEKVHSSRTRKVVNRAAMTFRLCAYALLRSKTALGAYTRRMKQRLGTPKALTATARKLACIFYHMLKNGTPYVDIGMDYYEQKYKDRIVKNLKKRAEEFGFSLVENSFVLTGVS